MNIETNTPRCLYTLAKNSVRLYAYIYKNRMSVFSVSTLLLKIGDFTFQDKARNAFLTRGFLPSDAAKIV